MVPDLENIDVRQHDVNLCDLHGLADDDMLKW